MDAVPKKLSSQAQRDGCLRTPGLVRQSESELLTSGSMGSVQACEDKFFAARDIDGDVTPVWTAGGVWRVHSASNRTWR